MKAQIDSLRWALRMIERRQQLTLRQRRIFDALLDAFARA